MRREKAALYAKLIKGTDEVKAPYIDSAIKHSFNYYTVRVKNRDKLQKKLKQAGIGSMIYYPLCLHLQEVYKDLGYNQGDFPEAEKAQDEVLSLPMFPELLPEQIEEVISVMCDS